MCSKLLQIVAIEILKKNYLFIRKLILIELSQLYKTGNILC